jgi:hypothetical protein
MSSRHREVYLAINCAPLPGVPRYAPTSHQGGNAHSQRVHLQSLVEYDG